MKKIKGVILITMPFFLFILLILIILIGAAGGQSKDNRPPAKSDMVFLWPTIHFGEVNGNYGARIDPINGTASFHYGIDLKCNFDEPLYAVGKGTVEKEYIDIYGALVIVVKHDDKVSTLYAHMNSFTVDVGDTVERGQMIATCGSTGYSTGPHLHLEVRINGKTVDPYPYLTMKIVEEEKDSE